MFQLTYTDGSDPITVPLSSGGVTVGRSPQCDLVVQHPSVSRRHAKFQVVDDRCYVQDVGSRLGTFRNGELVTAAELVDGDYVLLGQLRFDVRESIESVALSDEHAHIPEATILLPRVSAPAEDHTNPGIHVVSASAKGISSEIEGQRMLTALYEIGSSLVRSKSLSEILDKVVALSFDMIAAERVFLMLKDERTGDLVPRVARRRDNAPMHGASISRTIARRVMADRVSLLASDAHIDSRLDGADSIILQQIRSCMCAPLWNETDVIGILYVDSPKSQKFNGDDLNLFSTLANYAAIAIEQARLSSRLREETRRRERLQRYHSPSVVDRILEGGDEAESAFIAQEREVSVLFADIVGFTSKSEHMAPSQVAHLLNGFFGVMTDVIFQREGTLDKFIGDAILAIFGAPLSQADHAVRCVRAAMEMREALVVLNASRSESKLQMRIAINSGNALVGDMGAPKRREFTVLGDVVNTASRLESEVAQPDQIVIGAETYRLIKDEIPVKPLGSFKVRGRTSSIDVYQV